MKAFGLGFVSMFSLGLAVVFLIFWWTGRAVDEAVKLGGLDRRPR